MKALEVEETESFITSRTGAGGQRKAKGGRGPLDVILSLASEPRNRNRLAVVGILLCLVLIVVTYQPGDDTANKPALPPVQEGNPPPPPDVASPPPPPDVNGGDGEPPDAGDDDDTDDQEPAETPSEGGEESNYDDDDDDYVHEPVKDENGNIALVYSNMATIKPDPFHQEVSKAKKEELAEKWGKWHFWDGDEDMRVDLGDYCGKYPNRDIPGDDFPDDAWQVDAVYVNHYLNDGDLLVSRAMEAIFTEYGHGKPLPTEELAHRMAMFHIEKLNLTETTEPPAKFGRRGDRGNGGWTTPRSFDGLVRRLTHAMMTQDTFTVVMGGHSAAQGQGNHFRQSYMMVFHRFMAPIFARLGVKLITRNVGQGGLGTVQAAMGSGSIYGDEIDVLMWDSGMTEGNIPPHVDLFMRQGLIGGNRVPFLWSVGGFDTIRMLHEHADADVGEWGYGLDGVIRAKSAEHALTIPYAARYLRCEDDALAVCNEEPRFCSTCWIERDDVTPPNQFGRPKGQVKWHPGWRMHQLVGRVLSFTILEALQVAINRWSNAIMSGPPLADEFWHVTEYYENIRSKVKNLDPSIGDCYQINATLPTRMCNTPMKGRTQYTPRADYHETSITSILKPAPDGYVPKNEKVALYEGPDAHNPCFDIPDDAIDVLAIVSNRRQLLSNESISSLMVEHKHSDARTSGEQSSQPANVSTSSAARSLDQTEIVPGKGWQVFDEPQGLCDGTYDAVCARGSDSSCVLIGHHDGRGAVIGNELAGWLVMELKGVKAGLIVVKLHTWHYADENSRTKRWQTINNEPGNEPGVTEIPNAEPANAAEGNEDAGDADAGTAEGEAGDADAGNADGEAGDADAGTADGEAGDADAGNAEEQAGDADAGNAEEQAGDADAGNAEPENADTSAGDVASDNAETNGNNEPGGAGTAEANGGGNNEAGEAETNENRRRLGASLKRHQAAAKDTDRKVPHSQTVVDSDADAFGNRRLMRSYSTPELPETFQFEFAIDGKITTLTKEQFLDQKKQVQRVVETLTLLDDPNFTTEEKDVEVAIRMRGCGHDCTFGVSHIYWA